MTKDEFLQRFLFKPLANSAHLYIHDGKIKHAAVLIPLIDKGDNSLNVLFTKRAEHLKHHPGQISFPGGKVEEYDNSLIETALRESHEEIGLTEQAVTIIGQLKPYHTISGYLVTPIVALVKDKQHFQMDENEVSEIFQVPLTHFLQTQNHIQVNAHFNGKHHPVNYMPYQNYNIWGATASMLKDLASHLA